MSCFTREDLNILCPRSNCTTTASSLMWMNLYKPSYTFRLGRCAGTGKPAGSLRSSNECSFYFCLLVCLSPNAIVLRTWSLLTFSLTLSISLDLAICKRARSVWGGRGITPKTRMALHKPSGPTMQRTTNKSTERRDSWSLVWRLIYAQTGSYASLREVWYFCSAPTAPSVSTVASCNCTPNVSAEAFNSFVVYANFWSKTR